MLSNNGNEAARKVHTVTAWKSSWNCAVAASWVVNVLLLVIVLLWIVSDGQSPRAPVELWDRVAPSIRFRLPVTLLAFAVVVGGGSTIFLSLGLVCGSTRFRSLRSWLLAMALACCWCGLFASWSQLHWWGQQARLTSVLPKATALVQTLQSNWPNEDGEIEGMGLFMAYPKQSPSTLLMMGESRVPLSELLISCIEKSEDGALRLELSGSESGAWLEWRPDGSEPTSFVGGLRTRYRVKQHARLGQSWSVVRYESSDASESIPSVTE